MDRPTLTVIDGAGPVSAAPGLEVIESPPCPVELSAAERDIWDHICTQLRAARLQHLTAALAISVIVKKYARWVDAQRLLDVYVAANNGSWMVRTPNGYEQPHQLVYLVEKLEKELLRWLPQAALTIPSCAKVRALEKSPGQGDPSDAGLRDFLARRPV